MLDPACSSGNFLYLAYRELKRLEARIYERIDAEFPSHAEPGQVRLSFLCAQNFLGRDINPLAVEIAKVAMKVARKLAIDELHIAEQPLPLDTFVPLFSPRSSFGWRGRCWTRPRWSAKSGEITNGFVLPFSPGCMPRRSPRSTAGGTRPCNWPP